MSRNRQAAIRRGMTTESGQKWETSNGGSSSSESLGALSMHLLIGNGNQ